ncbi:uncharacterized protein N7458_001191 [Penicillium daleae]|uniref:Uncharacterized protein n=1 Tax=Penicillium daleae TaxID=63821 RepID=A0AAD6G4P8_9EURO|nr:uncharacterized protein N7458_001191 [Penicillium daleae]KAJ5459639.1 hypothetical protein N7458_001191 [Penicillium daleae]
MAQPPWGNQLPGLADDQVGTSDLPENQYPWNQPSGSQLQPPIDTNSRPHSMQMRPGAIDQNCDQFSGLHAVPSPASVESTFPQPARFLSSSASFNGNMVMPPASTSPQSVTNTWNMVSPQQPPQGNDLPPISPASSFVPVYHGHPTPHIHEQHALPEAVGESLDPEGEQVHDLDSCDTENFAPLCEFSRPCQMSPSPDGVHFRKIVSHLFGRNKASTKLFPDSVWVYYCRKHYQRARYRAEQWPFNQCELLMQSLDRMEQWGHVLCFELRLRRREALRADGQGERPAPTGLLGNGRRHPTAITAPVPEWLQREVGTGKSFDEIRNIVERIRTHLTKIKNEEDSKKLRRTKPNGGATLSKDDRKLAQNAAYHERNSLVRFPDIEILPTFDPLVIEEARQRSSQKKRAKKGGSEKSHEQEHTNGSEEYSEDDEEIFEDGAAASGQGVAKALSWSLVFPLKEPSKSPSTRKRDKRPANANPITHGHLNFGAWWRSISWIEKVTQRSSIISTVNVR